MEMPRTQSYHEPRGPHYNNNNNNNNNNLLPPYGEREIHLPYLLEYKSHSCISRTPTLELKIGTKLF